MNKTENFKFNLPNRDNPDELADINVISENFEKADKILKEQENKSNELLSVVKKGFYYKYDFNGDGVVDMDDSTYLQFHINFPDDHKIPWWCEADVNGDGVVDMDDVTALIDWLENGNESAFAIVQKTDIVDENFSGKSEKPIQNKAVSNGVANALKGTASGSVVAMTDVSHLEHNIGVKLSSDTLTDFSSVTLTKYGKNLYDTTQGVGNSNDVYNGWLVNDENSKWYRCIDIDTLPDIFTLSTKVICDNYGSSADTTLRIYFYDADQNQLSPLKIGTLATAESQKTTVTVSKATVPNGTKYVGFMIRINSAGYSTDTQLEIGTTATEYEPYKDPVFYTPKADGTVEGICGNGEGVTLMTDAEGVSITAEYNRDLNKVIESLTNAIISLGGNV